MPQLDEFLASRWKADWNAAPPFARLRDAHTIAWRAHAAVSKIGDQRAALQKPGDLTTKGLNERLRNACQADVVPSVRRAAHLVDKAKQEIAATRGAMKVPRPDPTDAAGAIRRMDIRSCLRSMAPAEATKIQLHLQSPNVDTDLLMAVFEVPAFVSGMPDEVRASIEKVIIERSHATELQIVEEMAEAMTVVDGVIQMALIGLAEGAGFESPDDYQFSDWIQFASRGVEQEIKLEEEKGPVVGPADLKATAELINSMNAAQVEQLADFVYKRRTATIGIDSGPVEIPEFAA